MAGFDPSLVAGRDGQSVSGGCGMVRSAGRDKRHFERKTGWLSGWTDEMLSKADGRIRVKRDGSISVLWWRISPVRKTSREVSLRDTPDFTWFRQSVCGPLLLAVRRCFSAITSVALCKKSTKSQRESHRLFSHGE